MPVSSQNMLSRLSDMIKRRVKRVSLTLQTRQFPCYKQRVTPTKRANKHVLALTVKGSLQLVVIKFNVENI